MNPFWIFILGLPALGLHLISVTLTTALRSYSRSRLEEICERGGRDDLAHDVAHRDERTERSAESLAVVTGLMLAALLGATANREIPSFAAEAALAIALFVGAIGYVIAGVIGRVFAEQVISVIWPASTFLRFATGPLTWGNRQLESIVAKLARKKDDMPRPSSVEVEIPNDSDHPESEELEIPESTRELLEHAVTLTRRDVSELMTPRTSIAMLSSSASLQTAARLFRESGLSRLPIYGENRDDIVGILYQKDLFAKLTEVVNLNVHIGLREIARPAHGVPETKNAYELLEEFRTKRTHMALALDEYGGLAGLITLEDLLEEIVGPIDDEHDVPTPEDPVLKLDDSSYEVDASLDLETLNDKLSLKLPTDGDFLTVGGLAFHILGRVPEPGTSFRQDGVEFLVMQVVDHAIRRVRINVHPEDMIKAG